MSTLTLSASVPAFKPPDCVDYVPFSNSAQYAIFFFGLYLIALGTGGIKPCISSFGADQFDDTDPKERVTKGFLLQLVLFFYQHWRFGIKYFDCVDSIKSWMGTWVPHPCSFHGHCHCKFLFWYTTLHISKAWEVHSQEYARF